MCTRFHVPLGRLRSSNTNLHVHYRASGLRPGINSQLGLHCIIATSQSCSCIRLGTKHTTYLRPLRTHSNCTCDGNLSCCQRMESTSASCFFRGLPGNACMLRVRYCIRQPKHCTMNTIGLAKMCTPRFKTCNSTPMLRIHPWRLEVGGGGGGGGNVGKGHLV